MTPPSKILTESLHGGQVVRITLHAPQGNVLDAAMLADLQAGLAALQPRAGVKLVQLVGAGEHFSFGASVAEHTRDRAPRMLAQFHGLLRTLTSLDVPTAALVSGQCLGGGLELALACHFLFTDESARLGQPEIALGVFPPPASLLLPLKIGQARADELLLTGRSLTGAEAAAIGLACACFPARAAMLAGVGRWTEQHLLPKSASSLRFAARAARQGLHDALDAGLPRLEAMYLGELMATHDANEGIAAFLEHRQAVWENR